MRHYRLYGALSAAIALSLLLPLGAWSQKAEAPIAFEVATVKPVVGTWVHGFRVTPDSISFGGATLGRLIRYAYNLRHEVQTSGPSWIDSGELRFDVTGKAGRAVTTDELRLMLRTLLAERWQLVLHPETRELKVWVLSTGMNGPKFAESRTEGESRSSVTETRQGYRYERYSMEQLAADLSDHADWLVLNETGLKGRYDFEFDFLQYATDRKDFGPAMAVGIGKTGLKLEQRRRPVEVLVVDSVEKNPTAD